MAIGQRLLDELRLHELDVTDEADVARFPLLVCAHELLTQVNVVTGHAERVGATGLQRFANLAVDLDVEGLLDDLHGGGVGDAHAATELGLDAGFIHGAGDGLATAVHDDDLDADRREKSDIRGDAVAALGIRVIHEASAILHHEGGATELLDIREGFEKDLGFIMRGVRAHQTDGKCQRTGGASKRKITLTRSCCSSRNRP